MGVMADQVKARAADGRLALLYEDQQWTYAEWVQECADRASLFRSFGVDGPPHVGVLLPNTPDFTMWLGAAALLGASVVGNNPTRRGEELARDIRHSDCQLIVTDTAYRPLLDGLDLGPATDRLLVTDDPSYTEALAPHRGSPLPDVEVAPAHQFLLLFTSGTSR
jgi:fatty-acyl-CoA synthase